MTRETIPLFKVFLPPRDALMPELEEVLYSGQISEGEPVKAFENEFQAHFKTPNPVSFYSGTAALHGALILAGVKPGDEVISTPVTAEPSNMAIRHSGADVVWGDVDPRNGNLDPDCLGDVITPKTKAIMVVHYGGIPAAMSQINQVAGEYGIPVIEDAAHALGAEYNGQLLGVESEYIMFSFQAIKHMTTVDGGMLGCRSEEMSNRARLIRWFGIDRNASRTSMDVPIVGYKYHMNNVNATIGRVQLRHIQPILDRHIANGKYFDEHLSKIPGITCCTWDEFAKPSYWFYTVLVDSPDAFIEHLQANGVAASQIHKRNDLHTIFRSSQRELPGVDEFYKKMVHIPCGWWLSDEDRIHMVDVISRG